MNFGVGSAVFKGPESTFSEGLGQASGPLYKVSFLIGSYINHHKFVSANNVLREHNGMKEEIKNPENAVEYTILKQWKFIGSVVREKLRTKLKMSEELNKIN